MPFTPDEAPALAADAKALAEELFAMFKTESPGGRRATRDERRALLQHLLKFASRLATDIVD